MATGCVPVTAPGTTTQAPSEVPGSRPNFSDDFVSRIDGSTVTIPLMTTALQLLRGTADGLHFNQTDQAYQNLIAGDKDVIFVTAPSPDELAAAQAAGVTLDVVPVVNDAMVFLVNTANPVANLTSQQVKDIYSGKITNWSQVGGADQPIVAYQRPVNSGSQTLFLQLVMGDTTPVQAPDSYYISDMAGLIDRVAAYDNSDQAIGYSFFYYAQEMHVSDNVKLVSVDGVAPTPQTIADGSYPYITSYFAVMRSDEPDGSQAKQLVDWCLTDEGQQTFSAASYVPLDPSNVVPPVSGYGYDGSTPQNTTQSSGTGGPPGSKAQWGTAPDPCDFRNCMPVDTDGKIVHVNIPDYPQLQSAIIAWLQQETLGTMMVSPGSKVLEIVIRDLMLVWIGSPEPDVSVMLRMSDGHRMVLSDFFYDGVNYIDFINRTLLNEGANRNFVVCDGSDDVDCTADRVGPFTGLPADTTDYDFNFTSLAFQFPAGNPFITSNIYDPVQVQLLLPYDLSPYGITWQVQQTQVGGRPVQHVVSNYASVNPQDAKINQAIDNWVAKQPGDGRAGVEVSIDESGGEKARLVFTVQWSPLGQGDYDSAEFDWAKCQQIR